MHTMLNVALGDRSYPIHIGEGVLSNPDYLLPHIRGKQVLLVSNVTVAPLYASALRQNLTAAGLAVAGYALPAGRIPPHGASTSGRSQGFGP